MDAVPEDIDPTDVRRYLEQVDGVASVHDLHIWAMSTTETALTSHLVMPGGHPGDAFLANLCEELGQRFTIRHATFQIELGDASRLYFGAGARRLTGNRRGRRDAAPASHFRRNHPANGDEVTMRAVHA